MRIKAAGDQAAAVEEDERHVSLGLRPIDANCRAGRGGLNLVDVRPRAAKAHQASEGGATLRDRERSRAATLQREHIDQTPSMRIKQNRHKLLSLPADNLSAGDDKVAK